MKSIGILALFSAAAVIVVGLIVGCTPAGECVSNADCGEGEICNVNGECSKAFLPPPTDATWPDRYYHQDRATPEDAPPEDAIGSDQTSADAGFTNTDAAGQQQVSSFATCAGEKALTTNSSGSQVFVGCKNDDNVTVYDSISGAQIRTINLPLPGCQPTGLLLKEDAPGGSQLWVMCSRVDNRKVYVLDPGDGAKLDSNGWDPSSASGKVRFAHGGDLVGWADTSDTGTSWDVIEISSRSSFSSISNGTGLNRSSDIAISSNGDRYYLLNTLLTTYKEHVTNGGSVDISLAFNNPTHVAITPDRAQHPQAPAQRVLVFASTTHQNYARYFPNGTVAGGSDVSVQLSGLTTMVMHPDGAFAYLTSRTGGQVYKIATDPNDSNPDEGSISLVGCQPSDMAATNDSRVFLACGNGQLIEVHTDSDF